jgi:hypothetical protein
MEGAAGRQRLSVWKAVVKDMEVHSMSPVVAHRRTRTPAFWFWALHREHNRIY